MRKIAITVASIVLLASISSAQINHVTVKVDGLACAFCAYGLQKGLKRVEGVRDVKVLVDAGRAELQFKKGVPVGLEEIGPAVKRAGYTSREIRIEATGRLGDWNGSPALFVEGNGEKLLLNGSDVLKRLRQDVKAKGDTAKVTAVGTLEQVMPAEHHGHPVTLHLQKFNIEP